MDKVRLKLESFQILRQAGSTDPSYDLPIILFYATLIRRVASPVSENPNETKANLYRILSNSEKVLPTELIEIYKFLEPKLGFLPDFALHTLIKKLEAVKFFSNIEFQNFVEDAVKSSEVFNAKLSSNFSQPIGLSKLIYGIAELHQNIENAFIPFAQIGDLIIEAKNGVKVFAIERDHNAWAICVLRKLAQKDNTELNISRHPDFWDWAHANANFDLIAATPPLGLSFSGENTIGKFGKYDKIEQFIIEKGIKSLSDNGRLIINLTQNFLFTSSNYSKELRKYLVDSNFVDSVILLPKGIYSYTSIQTVLLVLKNASGRRPIKFIDASNCFKKDKKLNSINVEEILSQLKDDKPSPTQKFVDYNLIAENDFNLNISRYLSEPVEGTSIGDITETYRGDKSSLSTEGKLVKIKDLKSSLLDYHLNFDEINLTDISQKHRQINQSCILIAARYKTLKPTYFEYNGEPIYIDNNIFAIIPDAKKVRIDFFIYLLHTSKVLKQIESFQSGAVTPFITITDFLKIRVDLPKYVDQHKNFEEQKTIFTEAKFSEQEKTLIKNVLSEKVEKNKQEYNEALREKQHCIRQHLKNVIDSIAVINSFMERQNGTIHLNDIINPDRNTTVAQRFEAMSRSIQSLRLEIDNLTNDDVFDSPEQIGIRDIISECILEFGENKNFSFQESFDEIAFDELGNTNPKISISRRSFKELFNNIVMNASKHGFVDDKDYIIKIVVTIENNKLKVSFLNNGKPLAEGLAKQMGIKGKKAGLNAGSGIGAWKIFEIAKHYDFDCQIIDLPADEFPVVWEFKFNLIEKD